MGGGTGYERTSLSTGIHGYDLTWCPLLLFFSASLILLLEVLADPAGIDGEIPKGLASLLLSLLAKGSEP